MFACKFAWRGYGKIVAQTVGLVIEVDWLWGALNSAVVGRCVLWFRLSKQLCKLAVRVAKVTTELLRKE